METFAVIDFETTGLSPDHGSRPTEIGVALIRDGKIIDRYQSLMNAGVRIPADIVAFTGITNEMVKKAPRVDVVMREAADFVGTHPLVAHNAPFDRKFWDAELAPLQRKRSQDFACSMLLSRRVFPNAPNHRLGSLVETLRLPATGKYHRALADAEAAAHLIAKIQTELMSRYALTHVSHEMLVKIQKVAKDKLDGCMARFRRDAE